MTAPPQANQQRLLLALLNGASTDHRHSILNDLVSEPSSLLEVIAERSLRLSLPEDDELLRSLLANEIATHGEAETLVKWALKFTSSANFICVLKLKGEAALPDICETVLREYAPKLRERFGQDEIYFSPDQATADMQIELLFPDNVTHTPASTASELPTSFGSLAAPLMASNASASSQGESATSQVSGSTAVTSTSPFTRPQSRASSVLPSNTFKARSIPATVMSRPSIEPRLSKAAALRMGITLPAPQDSPARTASRLTSPSKDAANVGISGVVKRAVAPPVSLKAPSIAPRLNKAALARQGGPAQASAASVAVERKPVDFSSTPGHKRLSSITRASVASTAPPAIAPRLNKAALARQGGAAQASPVPRRPASVASAADVAQRQRKPIDFSSTPGHKRLSLAAGPSSIASIAPPTIAPRLNKAALARQGGTVPADTPQKRLSLTATAPRQNRGSMGRLEPSPRPTAPPSAFKGAAPAGHKRANSLSVPIAALAAPKMPPRQNRASLARTQPSSSSKPGAEAGVIPRQPTDFSATPGHKRASLNLSLASLRAPAIQPRPNRASLARTQPDFAGASRS